MPLDVEGPQEDLAFDGLGLGLENFPVLRGVGQMRGDFLSGSPDMQIQVKPIGLRFDSDPSAHGGLRGAAFRLVTSKRSDDPSVG